MHPFSKIYGCSGAINDLLKEEEDHANPGNECKRELIDEVASVVHFLRQERQRSEGGGDDRKDTKRARL